MTRIVKFTAKNWMGIKAAEITPNGKPVVLGGENGEGKSSLLTGLQTLVGGKKHCPDMPMRTGTSKAVLAGDFGGFKVRREFTRTGDKLVVTGEDGAKVAKPQGYLTDLADPLGFDVSKWLRQSDKEQAEQISKMGGVDLAPLDGERKGVFDERTDVNRYHKRAAAQVAGAEHHPDAPAAEVSIADISGELQTAQATNAANDKQRAGVDAMRTRSHDMDEFTGRLQDGLAKAHNDRHAAEQTVNAMASAVESSADIDTTDLEARAASLATQIKAAKDTNAANASRRFELDGLRTRLGERVAAADEAMVKVTEQVAKLDKLKATGEKLAANADALADVDLAPIKQRIEDADKVNAQVRANATRAKLIADRDALGEQAQALTDKLDDIDERKRAVIAAADYPLEGITVADGMVMFEGVPFSQVNRAQQLKIAVSVALAMVKDKELKLVIIEEGAFFSPKNQVMVAEMVTAAGADLWIEVVGDGPNVTYVIEDGAVIEDRTGAGLDGEAQV